MKELIEKQLKHCKVARIPEFNSSDQKIIIPRLQTGGAGSSDFELGCEYDIEVEDYILYPYPGFTLHDNWNKGVPPTDKRMHIIVSQIMGKMIQVQATGIQDNQTWVGWLPKKSCKQI